ncbi:MAG: hypothetical protein WAL50_11155 [Kineosporiaceae bacterium]
MRAAMAPVARRTLGIRLSAAVGLALTCSAAGMGPARAETTTATTTAAGATVAAPLRATPVSATVQVHYAAPSRTADGVIDAARTLDAIKARGSRVYFYLLYPHAGYDSTRDWQSLLAFLVAARARGISVHVTLTPPSSTSSWFAPCSANLLRPFGGRYDTWMVELGRLARHHANLSAVVMDDYAYSATNRPRASCRSFAPGTLTRWNSILTRFAGRRLRVLPVLYLHDLTGVRGIYPSIKKEAPEVVWPFTAIGSHEMKTQYRAILKAAPTIRAHVMVYAAPYKGRIPTAATIREEMGMARRLGAAGVVIYQQPLH